MKPIEIIHVPYIELCSVNLILPIGQVHDPNGLIGVTHLIEHLFFQSHPKYSQEEFMIKIEEMGGIFNAMTDREMTLIYGKIQKRYVNDVIKIFMEAINNLSNSIEHVETERAIIITELQTASFKPYQKMFNIQREILFDSPSYKANQYIKNDLKTIKKEEVLEFMNHYDWKNWKLLIVGDIKENEIDVEIKGKTPNIVTPILNPLSTNQSYENVGKDKGITASVLLPEYFNDLESIILSNILFKGISSPFYSEVIKQNGIAYNIEVSVNRYQNNKYLEFGWRCHEKDVEVSSVLLNRLIEKTLKNEFIIENFVNSGIQKTKTEILLIQENFIRFSNHVTKQIALDTYSKGKLDEEIRKSSNNIVHYGQILFEQPKLIGFHK